MFWTKATEATFSTVTADPGNCSVVAALRATAMADSAAAAYATEDARRFNWARAARQPQSR